MNARKGFSHAVILIASLLCAAPLHAQAVLGQQARLSDQEIDEIRAAIRELDGRVIIGFKPENERRGVAADGSSLLSEQQVADQQSALETRGITILRSFRLVPAVAARIDPAELESLIADPSIDYVEPDRIVFNVPIIESGPSSLLTAQDTQQTPWGITRIATTEAWAITKGSGGKLGIIDTGIDEDHPDLNVLRGMNFVTGDTTRSGWTDDGPCGGHGTHVAGSSAALDNTIGVVGVAPEADVYALKVFDIANGHCGAYTSDTNAAIEKAVEWELDVVNLSLGGSYPSISASDLYTAAWASGLVIVASAGNSYAQVGYPGGYPHAIAVAATHDPNGTDFGRQSWDTLGGEWTYFSSNGPEVEVGAPGRMVLSTVPDGELARYSGTSMSAPHVAGVATLVRASRPDLTPNDVREILQSTSEDIVLGRYNESTPGYDYFTGHGIVRPDKALGAVGTTATAIALGDDMVRFHADPGSAPDTTQLQIRNIGGVGTITWSAESSASWLTVSPSSGTVNDTTPISIDVITDPTGLAAELHRGSITVTGDAANSPVQTRVLFSVTESITPGATALEGTLKKGERRRYAIVGTAGQKIDAVVMPKSNSDRLNPFLRLFMPDGETALASNNDGSWIGPGSLISDFELPEDGVYFFEIGTYADEDPCRPEWTWCENNRNFVFQVREAGPMLRLGFYDGNWQDIREGSIFPVRAVIGNGTNNGDLTWSAKSSSDWISVSQTTGAESGESGNRLLSGAPGKGLIYPRYAEREDPGRQAPEGMSGEAGDQRTSESDDRAVPLDTIAPLATQTQVTISLDASKTGLSPSCDTCYEGRHRGAVVFESSDTWLIDLVKREDVDKGYWRNDEGKIEVEFSAYVYSREMQLLHNDDRYIYSPWPLIGIATKDSETVKATSDEGGGSLYELNASGISGTALATGISGSSAANCISGLANGTNGDSFVGDRCGPDIRKISSNGSVETWATLPSSNEAVALTALSNGDLYAADCGGTRSWNNSSGSSHLYKISSDNSTSTTVDIGVIPGRVCPGDIVFNPGDDALYLAGDFGIENDWSARYVYHYDSGVQRVSLQGEDLGIGATNLSRHTLPRGLAVGRSGIVYIGDSWGSIWTYDPSSGVTSDAELLGRAPQHGQISGMALIEGSLVLAVNSEQGRFYRFPVNDAPTGGIRVLVAQDGTITTEGETLRLQTKADLRTSGETAVSYEATLDWPTDAFSFVSVVQDSSAGTGGTFTIDTSQVSEGKVSVSALDRSQMTESINGLFDLNLSATPKAARGEVSEVKVEIGKMDGPDSQSLLNKLHVAPFSICVDRTPLGDLTGDSSVGALDAVQILRSLVYLELQSGSTLAMGDVTGDGTVGVADAAQILRHIVDLPLPSDSRVDRATVRTCPRS